MYSTGQGIRQNDAEAVKWFRKAAEQGHTKAQFNLGVLYDKGQGVAQSSSEAEKWYTKAAERGDVDAQTSLGPKWYRKAAEQGDAEAQYNLGLSYANGHGVEQSDTEAVKWYRKAAEQGYAPAQNNLGRKYAEGEGVEQSDAEAVKWFRKAAEQGNETAQRNLDRFDEFYKDKYEENAGRNCSDKGSSIATIKAIDSVKQTLPFNNEFVGVVTNYLGDCTHRVSGYVDSRLGNGMKVRRSFYAEVKYIRFSKVRGGWGVKDLKMSIQ